MPIDLNIIVDLEWFKDVIERLSGDPLLQGWIAGVATFFFENVVCWTMLPTFIATGYMQPSVAFHAAVWGVFIGDILMYLPARFAMRYVNHLKWFQNHKGLIGVFEEFFSRHLGKTLFVIRFTPGIRTFALIAAGMLRVPILSYIGYSFLSCLLQATLVVMGGKYIFRKPIEWVTGLWSSHPILAGTLIGLCGISFIIANTMIAHRVTSALKRKANAFSVLPEDTSPVAAFEFWNPLAFIIPVIGYSLIQMARFRGVLLPTNLNPAISRERYFLESKIDILQLLHQYIPYSLAPFAVISAAHELRLGERVKLVEQAGLPFPFVIKPDISYGGHGIRLIRGTGDLEDYLRSYPREQRIIIQTYFPEDVGASIAYHRAPFSKRGKVFSVVLREPLVIYGDGEHTLRQLILGSNRGRRLPPHFFKKHARILDDVFPKGEPFRASFTSSHRLGAHFHTLPESDLRILEEKIHQLFDSISGLSNVRINVKAHSEEALLAGEFKILGLTGVPIPLSMFDPSNSVWGVYRILFRYAKICFDSAAYYQVNGFPAFSLRQLLRESKTLNLLVKRYPVAD